MTPEELAAIEARANSATPGPWMITNDGGLIVKSDAGFVCDFARGTGTHAHDANFIATARTDVQLLLAEVKRLQAVLRDQAVWLREQCDAMESLAGEFFRYANRADDAARGDQ